MLAAQNRQAPAFAATIAAHVRFVRLLSVLGVMAAALAAPSVARATWCGKDVVSTERPDAVAGAQVHVLYAVPSDGAERFNAFAPRIAADLGAIDAWWRREDPSRTVRFDVVDFPGCASRLGRLDLTFVRLPGTAASYASESPPAQMRADFAALGFSGGTKKYLVFYDAPVFSRGGCGVVAGNDTRFALVFVNDISTPQGTMTCSLDLGSGSHTAAVIVHELVHALGLVPDVFTPPHTCATDRSHVCDDPRDLMNPSAVAPRDFVLSTRVLDAGRDDYYGHSGAWPDLQDSAWIARADELDPPAAAAQPRRTLAVTVRGRGKVTGGGLSCPRRCRVSVAEGRAVRLRATPARGFRFVRWTGGCRSKRPVCVVRLGESGSVTAIFARR